MKNFLSFLSVVLFTSSVSAQSLDKIWESTSELPVPESVLYVPERQELFVTLIEGAGNVKDGKGGVAILNMDGSMKNGAWVTGLNAPKGMGLYKDVLYIADITSVVMVDIVTGNVIDEVAVPESVFLNDITIDSNGVVYVSDTRTNKIHSIRNGKLSLFIENATSANGLKSVGQDLYVLAGKELWKIDSRTKAVTVFSKGFEQNGDGIEPVGNADFVVTCWAGIIYYVKADGTIQKIQDVQGKMNTADLGFNAKDRIVYIPTFNSNSVIAYKLK